MMRPLVWEVMSEAGGDPERLRAIGREATQEQLILLNVRVFEACWELANTLQGHLSPVDAVRTAAWLVFRGEGAVDAAQRSPASVAPAPGDVANPETVLREVYVDRFGETPPLREPDPVGRLDIRALPEWESAFESLLPLHHEAGVPVSDLVAAWTRSELVLLHAAGAGRQDDRARAVLDGVAREYRARYGVPVPA
ncbi:MAG: hypothetical protein R3F61_13740 [Myxococcota bacterium]